MKTKNILKLAIANRGEVAVRIIQACQELGIKTVLLHSEADINSRAYRLADETYNLGGITTQESYLNIQKNIAGALEKSADAIHPGFGFLSENADFAEACIANGMIFVGPMPSSIRQMGDKICAKNLMIESKVPVIPGYQGADQSIEKLKEEALKIGYPVLIKATAGGGGRGMKVATSGNDFKDQLESAKREALSAFGNESVFLEKYIEKPKHIEFQIFGDQFGEVVHLFERECSIQRRHQKIIEEAPSKSLSDEMRNKMAEAAIKAAKSVNYIGAGTVEFLLDGNNFYFLEMNTRLQVEHPVTEYITGTDLVKAQIQVAQGAPLPWMQEDLKVKGHSIECRLYAEDPYKMGMPSTGKILVQKWPDGPGRRFDYAFDEEDEVTPYYDPMIAKVIVWDENRTRAIQKCTRVLNETIIFGLKTNIPYLKEILNHPEFVSSQMTTKFIETYYPNALTDDEINEEEQLMLKELYKAVRSSSNMVTRTTTEVASPWFEEWRSI